MRELLTRIYKPQRITLMRQTFHVDIVAMLLMIQQCITNERVQSCTWHLTPRMSLCQLHSAGSWVARLMSFIILASDRHTAFSLRSKRVITCEIILINLSHLATWVLYCSNCRCYLFSFIACPFMFIHSFNAPQASTQHIESRNE